MRILPGLVLLPLAFTSIARAQSPLSRQQAIEAALARGARIKIAAADTAAARADLLLARAWQNPVLGAGYSEDAPRYHVTLELPLDMAAARPSMVRSATASRQAALWRYEYERASVMLAADTLYTVAVAARERAELSRLDAAAADSLRRLAAARRDAGDASELDVELATLAAGQRANSAAMDSLALMNAILELQAVIGLDSDSISIMPSDSLVLSRSLPPAEVGILARGSATPLLVASAQAELDAARFAALAERRKVFAPPSITAGFDAHDPEGGQTGLLPTFGFSIPLPLFNQNNGPIAAAVAGRDRAAAELAQARMESHSAIARGMRAQRVLMERVARDRQLVATAQRVANMSLTAYREGAAPITTALEAQRNAREVLATFVQDAAAASIATGVLRLLTLSANSAATR
jgi:cobalt-zinc-cadmium efflux system outer membrane protein